MADILKYQSHEVLNKVLNSAETALQVDIVSGAEYAEDSAHTDADTGNFILGVRNDSLAALGGTDGDYVPFQMNSSGALFVEVSSSSVDDSIYVDDANWTDGSSKHTLIGGLYQSSPQTITDGDVGPLQVNSSGNLIVDLSATDNAVLDAMVVDLAALEVLSTAANVDHAANEALLITIDADTSAIKTAVELLDNSVDGSYLNVNANIAGTDFVGGAGAVASGVQRITLASDDPAVVDLAAMEVLLTAANVDHAANEVLLGTIDADTDAIKTDMAAIEVLLTAANVDHAANEVLLGTIDSDTDAIKTAVQLIDNAIDGSQMQVDIVADGAGLATEASIAKMLYGTALVVTAVHGGSDHSLGATYEAFHIGVGGDVSLDCATSGTNIVFKNLASGQMLPVRATVVNATSTTATNIVALKA